MKRILLILVLFCTTIAFSQEKTFEDEVKKISKRIELITKTEKAALKIKVEKINAQLEKGEISSEQAQKLKKEAAEYHAKVISQKVAVEQTLLQGLVQDKANGKIKSAKEFDDTYEDEGSFTIGRRKFNIRIYDNEDYKSRRKRNRDWDENWTDYDRRNRRTTSQFVFALGVNNALVDNQLVSLENSNYKFWQSHFYELGWTWKTRLSEPTSIWYIKYGMSFLWNNLRPVNNMYHVKNGTKTNLITHAENLSENRLRHVQMTFPLHLEFDFSRNGEYGDGSKRDRTHRALRIGVGAFAGFKLGTRQYIEYTDANNIKVEEVQKDNFNMNVFNYGVSAYVAHRSIGFYAKYDLNPLFKEQEVRNLSLGLRFDLN
ncbi:MAG: hypothetical protein HWD85_08710 [Flavobacteriaceae bacterium]|nr:hypothetical protein [Flavobacteriaceae bacterium]